MSVTWVALLRGINVGRAKRIAMADLRAALSALGYTDVRTLGQSGNVIFASEQRAGAPIEREISAQIKRAFRMDVVVLARTGADFARIVRANPFVARGAAASELHVAFLSQTATPAKIDSIDREACAPDEFAVGKGAIYLRLPNGIMGSRMPDLERALGVRVTQRNWNTTMKVGSLVS